LTVSEEIILRITSYLMRLEEFLGLVKKAPREVNWREVQVYMDHSLEDGITPGILTNRLTSLNKFYDFVQEKEMDSPVNVGLNPVKEIERPTVNP
jgi:site-specific recombinase XerD